MKKRVLCLLADGFEEIELTTPVDLLRRAGVEVVMAALSSGTVTGRCGIKIQPDVELATAGGAENYDLLMIPGGPGVAELRTDGRAADLARDFMSQKKAVGAICAAPLVLNDAGLLGDRRFTCHFSANEELAKTTGQRVEVDGNLITSRGAGTALDFGLALVSYLVGNSGAAEVSAAIMA